MALRAVLCLLLAAILAAGCVSDLPAAEGSDEPDGTERPSGQGGGDDAEPSGADDALPAQDGPQDPGSDADAPTMPDDPNQADAPAGSNAGSATTHGEPERTDGSVDVRPEGGRYLATRLVTVRNDFGGADRSRLDLSTFNGAIALQPSQDGGYLFTAELYARGATEQDARQALDLLELQATDELGGDGLALSFTLVVESSPALPVPIEIPSSVVQGATFRLSVPPEPAHDVAATTANAAIAVSGLHGPRLEADSANAAIEVDGSWDRIQAVTSNAAIALGGGTLNEVGAETSNAAIHAVLDPTRSATVRLLTSNAAIAVDVPQDDGLAFDITADTINARVTIDVEGHASSEDGHGEYRSSGWDSAGIQLTLDLDTTNAAVTVGDGA